MIRTIVVFNMNTGDITVPTVMCSAQTADQVRREFAKKGEESTLLDIIEIDVENLRHEPHRRLANLIDAQRVDPALMSTLGELFAAVYKAGMRRGTEGR